MLTKREKVAYGLGDTASNIVFQTVMLFLTFFYTDIFGISPAVVGTMFLLVRIIDAVTDPLMGALADKTQSRHGKYRPYLLWLALPFALCSVLAFTTPDLSANGKVIYAFATYTLLMLAYTAINIPYSALGGVLTADPTERVSVQSYRFVFGMLGGLLVTACTLPLVTFFGNGDNAKGYQLTIVAMSALGLVLFLLCFAGTRERVNAPVDQQLTLKRSFASLWQNDQWRVLCVAAFFLLTGMVLRTTLAIYYVKYFLGREDLITVFVTLGMVGNIAGCAAAQWLSRYVDKVNAYIGLQLIAALISALSFFVGAAQLELAFALYFLWGFFLQMATPLLWAKMADTVDYGHYKTGIRITGLVYSSIVFFIKLGLALGGALAGWLLAFYQYQADSVQTTATQQGILLSFTVLPAIGSVVVALVMSRYRLRSNTVLDIHQQLQQRAGETAPEHARVNA
ncbi:glycoside-pentoside-hexuronide (GPH):cation symporter [Rheinheimera aquimaris]|jgi:GPH family glycoside/pentoside/hexuronide:cation symporter|uniref:glycoside-pentoside-hexuronide (GPH):cation symporter n=1 Tax=Rheinheimera aquimaris TaxID=412437 RepID=UPI0010663BF0|nr:MFS transporter [Rheinheimera aquimaris]|tara:strand:- start:309 stop:1670 length:1362 start_codon:yes stop_codon:yes gene_type:complete